MSKLSDLFGRKGGETGADKQPRRSNGKRTDGDGEHIAVEHYSAVGSRIGEENEALRNLLDDTGRKIGELNVSVQIRGANIRPGRREKELPTVGFTFYDSHRATAGETWLGPWRGSFAWREVVEKIKVPSSAREAIIRIGLGGATGEISFDDLSIEAVQRTTK